MLFVIELLFSAQRVKRIRDVEMVERKTEVESDAPSPTTRDAQNNTVDDDEPTFFIATYTDIVDYNDDNQEQITNAKVSKSTRKSRQLYRQRPVWLLRAPINDSSDDEHNDGGLGRDVAKTRYNRQL